jgi:hypothetical protein
VGRFIDEYGLVRYNPGQRFSLDGACEINGCAALRARFKDTIEEQAQRRRDTGMPPNTGHTASTRADSPLYIDHCHNHGWVRGRICAGCNSVMRFMDKKRCLPRYMPALREEFRRHYNQCADCEPMLVLPTSNEIEICRGLLCACAGREGPSWSVTRAWLRSHPFSGNIAHWLRQQALAQRINTIDVVTWIAQLPYYSTSADQVSDAIASNRQELDTLEQAWAGSYTITLEPTREPPWQARLRSDRRAVLKATSAAALQDLLQLRPRPYER